MCYPNMGEFAQGLARSRGSNLFGGVGGGSSPQPQQAQPQPVAPQPSQPAAQSPAAAAPAVPSAAPAPSAAPTGQPAVPPLTVSNLATGSVYSQAKGATGVTAPSATGSRSSVVQRG